MLREAELSNLTLSTVALTPTTATITLPRSKEDPTGLGTARTLGCACRSQLAQLCPLHVLTSHLEWAQAQAAHTNTPSEHFPLFPTTDGKPPQKTRVSATVVEIATRLDLPTNAPNGAPSIRGTRSE